MSLTLTKTTTQPDPAEFQLATLPDRGRSLVAKSLIAAGELILRQSPYAWVLQDDQVGAVVWRAACVCVAAGGGTWCSSGFCTFGTALDGISTQHHHPKIQTGNTPLRSLWADLQPSLALWPLQTRALLQRAAPEGGMGGRPQGGVRSSVRVRAACATADGAAVGTGPVAAAQVCARVVARGGVGGSEEAAAQHKSVGCKRSLCCGRPLSRSVQGAAAVNSITSSGSR